MQQGATILTWPRRTCSKPPRSSSEKDRQPHVRTAQHAPEDAASSFLPPRSRIERGNPHSVLAPRGRRASQTGLARPARRPHPPPEREPVIYQTQAGKQTENHRLRLAGSSRWLPFHGHLAREPASSVSSSSGCCVLAVGGMAASPEGKPPRPHGVVVIALPDGHDGWPSSSSSSTAGEAAVAFLDRAGAADAGADAAEWSEEERPRTAFSLRRAAGAVLALAALAAAGYFCLYTGADAGAALRFLAAAEEEEQGQGGRASFLLPLYSKARATAAAGVVTGAGDGAAQNSTAAALQFRGNVFPDRQYYTSISVGNPPRPYFLDVDTGSDLTWIQCDTPCTNCAKGPHPLYKPAQGNIVPPSDSLCQEIRGNQKPGDTSKQCDYEIAYADRSSSMGVLARDNMQLIAEDGQRENLDIAFGCAYDQKGELLNSLANTDGILGLSSAAISLPAQLASQGIISNAFGHCMTTDPSGDGYMFLGDDYIPRWGVTWVPLRNGPDNTYSVEVEEVNHGDQQLRKLTRVIFDSGSTYTYFPREAYLNLIAALKDVSPRFVQDDSDKTLPFCMKADSPVRSVDDVKQLFKPLTLQFRKRLFIFPRIFTINPEDYLIISDKGNICLGVLDGSEIVYGSAIVVGDVSLRGKLVVYDNDENRIGWIQSDCTNPRKQSGFPFFLRKALRNQFL